MEEQLVNNYKKENQRFKGRHWIELAQNWGMIEGITKPADIEVVLFDMERHIDNRLKKALYANDNSCLRDIEKDIRDFLRAMVTNLVKKGERNDVLNFWYGLIQIKNPDVFLKYSMTLLQHMRS